LQGLGPAAKRTLPSPMPSPAGRHMPTAVKTSPSPMPRPPTTARENLPSPTASRAPRVTPRSPSPFRRVLPRPTPHRSPTANAKPPSPTPSRARTVTQGSPSPPHLVLTATERSPSPCNVSTHICERCQRLQRICTRSDRPACDPCYRSHARCSYVIPNTLYPGTSQSRLEDHEYRRLAKTCGNLMKI
jgi:hypothetical protein